jgi:hypothetical protein
MLHMTLGQIIHQERQREIERNLERRRLLEHLKRTPSEAHVATPAKPLPAGPCLPARQGGAGALS